MLTTIAWVAVVLAVASFLLGAFVLWRGEPISGVLNYKSAKRELQGSDFGIFFVSAIVFLLLAVAVYKIDGVDDKSNDAKTSAPIPTPTAGADGHTDITDSSPVGSASSPLFTPTADSTMAFLDAYLDEVASGRHSASDLSAWFVLPADFYGLKQVKNLEKIAKEYAPRPADQRTTYQQPVFVSLNPDGRQAILNVSVDYTRADGTSGTTHVVYILEPADIGEPYRIRSVSEEAG